MDDSVAIPFTPVVSDEYSFENIMKLFAVIKRFDSKFWLRGETFGSLIFICFSLQLGYIVLQILVLKVPLFDVGKWDPKTDDSEYIQLFITSAAVAYLFVTGIVCLILLYGSTANEVDHDFVKLLNMKK